MFFQRPRLPAGYPTLRLFHYLAADAGQLLRLYILGQQGDCPGGLRLQSRWSGNKLVTGDIVRVTLMQWRIVLSCLLGLGSIRILSQWIRRHGLLLLLFRLYHSGEGHPTATKILSKNFLTK